VVYSHTPVYHSREPLARFQALQVHMICDVIWFHMVVYKNMYEVCTKIWYMYVIGFEGGPDRLWQPASQPASQPTYCMYSMDCTYRTYWTHISLTMNSLDRETKNVWNHKNLNFVVKYNRNMMCSPNTWCFLSVVAVILSLALYWKHALKKPCLIQMLTHSHQNIIEIQKCQICHRRTHLQHILMLFAFSLIHSDTIYM